MTAIFEKQAAQGDIYLNKIQSLPKDVKLVDEKIEYVVSHSETGHKHAIRKSENVKVYANDNNPFFLYLVVENDPSEVVHYRDSNTHKTIKIKPGVYEIRRQRQVDIYGEIIAALD